MNISQELPPQQRKQDLVDDLFAKTGQKVVVGEDTTPTLTSNEGEKSKFKNVLAGAGKKTIEMGSKLLHENKGTILEKYNKYFNFLTGAVRESNLLPKDVINSIEKIMTENYGGPLVRAVASIKGVSPEEALGNIVDITAEGIRYTPKILAAVTTRNPMLLL